MSDSFVEQLLAAIEEEMRALSLAEQQVMAEIEEHQRLLDQGTGPCNLTCDVQSPSGLMCHRCSTFYIVQTLSLARRAAPRAVRRYHTGQRFLCDVHLLPSGTLLSALLQACC
jgi:hypothetical protein